MMKFLSFFQSLRGKLITSFLILLLIPSIAIGSLAYLTAKDAVQSEVLSGFASNINLLNTTIDNTMQMKMHDMDFFSGQLTSDLYEEERLDEIKTIFTQYEYLHPESELIFTGSEDGDYVQAPDVGTPDGYDPRERPWYTAAMDKPGEVNITEPYVSASTQQLVVTLSKKLEDGSGVVGIDINLDYIQQLADEVNIGKTGYAFIVDTAKSYIAHPDAAAGEAAPAAAADELFAQPDGQMKESGRSIVYMTNETTGWKLAGSINDQEIAEAALPILQKTAIIIIAALIVGAAAVFFLVKSIIAPLARLREQAETISKGDLTQPIDIRINDEIGQLGHSFNEMQTSLKTLIQNVEQSVELVASSAAQLSASAEQTSLANEQVATSIQEVAHNAEVQTDSVDSTSRYLAEVTDNVQEIASNVTSISNLSDQSTKEAEDGSVTMTNTVNQMTAIHKAVLESNSITQSLHERSKEVRSILSVITEISEQTNLLALNAAIEAARAGEHGKGFAVVADEVRKLAEQSQTSATEIQTIVEGIQADTASSVDIMSTITDNVQNGVDVSKEAIEKFNHILMSMRDITPELEGLSETADHTSAAVQQVLASTNQIAGSAQSNAATSEEVAAASEEQLASMEEITRSADSLARMADDLKHLIGRFNY